MASRIVAVRFQNSVDMLRIGGGHTTAVSNDAPAGSSGGGVRASLGQLMGEKGLVLRREGDARWIFVPMASSNIVSISCVDEPDAAAVKK